MVHPVAGADDRSWYRFPLTVRLTGVDGKTAHVTVPVSGRSAAETFGVANPLRAPLAAVDVDPANVLLKVVESVGPF